MTRLGVGMAIVLVLAVLASFGLRFFAGDTPELVLPPVATQDGSGSGGEDPFADMVLRVEVTTDSVQEVIATLLRPAQYSRELTLETFWSADGQPGAVVQARSWVNNGCTRIDLRYQNGRTQHRIVTNEAVYLWYDSDRSYAVFPADDHSADLEQHIPTYEDVLALPPESITAAGYARLESVDCIFVEVDASAMGYREKLWVSVDSGLLVAAETWEGERLLYRMIGLQVSVPGEEGSFLLPDGTSVLLEES